MHLYSKNAGPMKIQDNLAFLQAENRKVKIDPCQFLCHGPASFCINAWEVPVQVADLWVCSKAAEVSLVSLASFGFLGAG